MFRLEEKIAAVTGGASGIGKVVCDVLTEAGATVYLLDHNREQGEAAVEEFRKENKKVHFIPCDLTRRTEVKAAFEQIGQEDGLDILVNNAGISHIGTIEDTSEAEFDRVMAVNVKGVYLSLQHAIPLLREAGGGSIVNISSIAAEVGLPDRFAYSASKGAVTAITYSIARDYIRDNIRCNAIAPARVHTPFVDGFLTKNYPGREAKMFKKLSLSQPIGRMGKPEEVATMVLYLCSEEASFITGTVFPIDGGAIRLNT